jgi:hypothetical protein
MINCVGMPLPRVGKQTITTHSRIKPTLIYLLEVDGKSYPGEPGISTINVPQLTMLGDILFLQ